MASAYSTYTYYATTYHGTLSESDYDTAVVHATQIIYNLTCGNTATGMENALKMCECEIVDAVYTFSQAPDDVASVNNDGYSASYKTDRSAATAYISICKKWLTMPENLIVRWMDV